jgi:hypothetical protein
MSMQPSSWAMAMRLDGTMMVVSSSVMAAGPSMP